MSVVIDTSVLVAFLHSKDSRHRDAVHLLRRVWRGELGHPVSLHDVLDEGLTVLQRRRVATETCQGFARLFVPDAQSDQARLALAVVDDDRRRRALGLFFERYDRGLSMTDCLLATVARDLDSPVASFDGGFDGIVQRIDR